MTYRDLKPEELDDDMWQAIWKAIKLWNIQRDPGCGYAYATGCDVCHIYDAVVDVLWKWELEEEQEQQ